MIPAGTILDNRYEILGPIAKGAWARSTARAARGSATRSRSRSSGRPTIPARSASGSFAKAAQRPASTIRASGPVAAPSHVRPDLGSSLDDIVLKGLARERHARWASAAEFGRALASTVDPLTATGKGVALGSGGFGSKYEFGAPLGKGRLGSAVHAGFHRALKHPVAIRTRRRGAERNWDAIRARFLKEAQAMQVSHPSILQVRDFGEEGDILPEIVRLTQDGDEQRLLISSPGIHHLADLLATLDEATLPALIGQMLREATADPRPDAPSLPDAAAAAIQTCLAENPTDRFENAAAFDRKWRSIQIA